MDPNANLEEQRRLVAWLTSAADCLDVDDAEFEAKAMRLAELVEALDIWLCRGAFAPSAWKRE